MHGPPQMPLRQNPNFQPRTAHLVIDVVEIGGEFVFGQRGRNDEIGFDACTETEAVDGPGVAFANNLKPETVVYVKFHFFKTNLTTESMTAKDGGNAENGGNNFLPEDTERNTDL